MASRGAPDQPTLSVRDSTEADLPAIEAIYAHHVLRGTGTFELEPPSAPELARRRAEVLGHGFPWLVACAGDTVVGYAYANYFRLRPAYRSFVEDSIYVAETARRGGVGTALLDALIERCEALDVRQMLAVIGDSANAGSIALHARCGFLPAGTFVASGWKFGRWLDTVLMQRPLGPGATRPPTRR